MKKIFSIASLFLILLIPCLGESLEYYPHFGPLTTRTQNPLYLLFLNHTPEAPQTLEKGHLQFSVETTVTNLLEQGLSSNGFLLDLDMELYRTAFNFSYSFHSNFETGIQIPFLSFSGGFLDEFILGYHNTFGFPNGGRDQVPNGRFRYLVSDKGKVLYSPNQSTFGLSDLNLYLKYRILEEKGKKPALSLRATFKIPTGDRGEGLGSGSPDGDINFALEKSFKRFHSYTNVGLLALGSFDPLGQFLNPVAVTFSQAFEINMTHIASVVAQIQGNSPLFHGTGISELDQIPLDLNIGFKGTGPRGGSWEHFLWEFAFAEDLIPSGPSVDFSVHFNLGAKF
jgi:uncharacterized protein DUF3187